MNVIFTTGKLRTLLPSLKNPVPAHIKSNVVDRITCPGWSSQYVGHTQLHLQKRCSEHDRASTPVGKHIEECVGLSKSLLHQTKVLGTALTLSKLLTLKAIFIAKLRPSLNSWEEFRQRHLMLRFWHVFYVLSELRFLTHVLFWISWVG